jgi:WD40 repeat protein
MVDVDLGVAVNDFAISVDDKFLAVACSDRSVRVWDLDARREVARINAEGRVNRVAVLPHSNWIVEHGVRLPRK